MTERAQCIVLDQLFQIKEPLFEAVENSQAFLVTGNALELFGTAIDDVDGTHIDGLGLFPFHTVRDMLGRYSSLYLGKYKDIDIVGYKSQFTQSYPDQPIPKLFDTVRGPGINRDSTEEGIHYKGFMGTYLLGPLLVLNPPFLIDLVEQITGYIPDLAFQDACIDAYRSRVTEYSDPARGFYY